VVSRPHRTHLPRSGWTRCSAAACARRRVGRDASLPNAPSPRRGRPGAGHVERGAIMAGAMDHDRVRRWAGARPVRTVREGRSLTDPDEPPAGPLPAAVAPQEHGVSRETGGRSRPVRGVQPASRQSATPHPSRARGVVFHVEHAAVVAGAMVGGKSADAMEQRRCPPEGPRRTAHPVGRAGHSGLTPRHTSGA
jgi:hypothetical protein